MRNAVYVGAFGALVLAVLTGCGSDADERSVGDDAALREVDRRSGLLGRCFGPSRVDARRQATLTHAQGGAPRAVERGSTLSFDAGARAILTVQAIASDWVSPNWNIFSASGTVRDPSGASPDGTFDLVVGPAVGVLTVKASDGRLLDFYRMACDADGVVEGPAPVPVAKRWSLTSRADDAVATLSSAVLLPSAGDALVLADARDPRRTARLSVVRSAAFPHATLISGTFVDRRRGNEVRGSFDLMAGADITVLHLRKNDGATWDFFGGTPEPEPATQVAASGVAHCVVAASKGTFASARPPRRGDRLTLDLGALAATTALRFNAGSAADPAIPVLGRLRSIPQADGSGLRLESADPGRVGPGLGVDLVDRGPGQLSTMWLSQNLLNDIAPAEVSLALLQCASEAFHTLPEPPDATNAGRCLVVSADGGFKGLAPEELHLEAADALDLPVSAVDDLDGVQSLAFHTRATGRQTITLRAPLAERSRDAAGIRFFAAATSGGIHVDRFRDGSVWIYDKVASQLPLGNATWALLTCPGGSP